MRSSSGKGIPGAALDRADGNAVSPGTKYPFNHVRLNDVESGVTGSVGTNIIDIVRGFSGAFEGHPHCLAQSENLIADVAITLRAISGDLQVGRSVAGNSRFIILQNQHSGSLRYDSGVSQQV